MRSLSVELLPRTTHNARDTTPRTLLLHLPTASQFTLRFAAINCPPTPLLIHRVVFQDGMLAHDGGISEVEHEAESRRNLKKPNMLALTLLMQSANGGTSEEAMEGQQRRGEWSPQIQNSVPNSIGDIKLRSRWLTSTVGWLMTDCAAMGRAIMGDNGVGNEGWGIGENVWGDVDDVGNNGFSCNDGLCIAKFWLQGFIL
ncbi:hypothetical protein M427DRAFT_48944 [Gonapodya prolifera JEL478]|uniref:Uncharacterized protein n=1 Tax=Gonapodya prolifera (strain JEL478) TaxID=1344416 RepID=A0A138ZZI1_GONPJ|nr:hypothetical protein M427DRAFT_48944 [Gonapodya prolifera JEL478]|eukprot:KXS09917.1 hypothetical protein M427DRAFT_48944 [Gonapodya prolifera JEL478]